MAHPVHLNPSAAVPPYKNLFSTVTIAPPGKTLAFISSQWAGDADGNVLHPNDAQAQSKVIWANIAGILKELGASMKDVVHRTPTFLEFNDDIGKAVMMGMMEAMPDEKEHWTSSSLTYSQVSTFHKPGVVYADLLHFCK